MLNTVDKESFQREYLPLYLLHLFSNFGVETRIKFYHQLKNCSSFAHLPCLAICISAGDPRGVLFTIKVMAERMAPLPLTLHKRFEITGLSTRTDEQKITPFSWMRIYISI